MPPKRLEKKLEPVRGNVHRDTEAAIDRYIQRKRAQGTDYDVIRNSLSVAVELAKHFPDRDVTRLKETDIEKFVVWINDEYAESTAGRYRDDLKHFYKTLEGAGRNDPAPELVRWIPGAGTTYPDLSTLIHPSDLRAMLNHGARNNRDRVLLTWLFQGGFRKSELLSLNLGNVEEENHGLQVTLNPNVEGYNLKTGTRTVRLVQECEANYKNYLENEHPEPGNPEAPLIVAVAPQVYGNRLSNSGSCHRLVKRIAERTHDAGGITEGLLDAINPKLFRHSSASWRVRDFDWGEANLRSFYGWEPGSPMPSYYVSLFAEDTDNRVLEDYGLREGEDALTEHERDLEPWKCICGRKNDRDTRYCGKCSRGRDLEAAEELEEAEEKAGEDAVTLEALMKEVQRLREEVENPD